MQEMSPFIPVAKKDKSVNKYRLGTLAYCLIKFLEKLKLPHLGKQTSIF